MGPRRSWVHDSAITPKRLMRPNVGRRPARPQRADGLRIEPLVSVPTPNATHPAAVADDGPADDPLEPCVRFHGLLVRPPNHWSFCANSPVVSLAISTAPALRSRTTTSASSSMMRPLKSAAPHVVGTPFVAKRSLTPYGSPCSGPRYLPDASSSSARAASAIAESRMIVTAQLSVGLRRSSRSR